MHKNADIFVIKNVENLIGRSFLTWDPAFMKG